MYFGLISGPLWAHQPQNQIFTRKDVYIKVYATATLCKK